ncbi:MAG TPA: nucleotidyltransferase [Bacteroidales bacterium]|jgi:NDP-sugar pyrophosphorylase family protein|nr:nucleotidyltransferase [Bacteroidales bacterium]
MQPTLLILAAGMGSRYGSLKQVDRFGPSGETIVEYSIYDALRAGFGKVVLVVRKEFVNDFREIILRRAFNKAKFSFVYQELENLPEGFTLPAERVKPWGTGHAVLMAENEITAPFAVINADDFYGPGSYRVIYDFLVTPQKGHTEEYCIVDYRLDNTLSESGSVSRGICRVDDEGYLIDIAEHKKIIREGKTITGDVEGTPVVLTGKEPVSMNLIGFRPSMFVHLKNQFKEFLTRNIGRNDAEFYIPFAMNEVIKAGKARVKAIHTNEKWFGVTYRNDREMVMRNLKMLVDKGVYPEDLWA